MNFSAHLSRPSLAAALLAAGFASTTPVLAGVVGMVTNPRITYSGASVPNEPDYAVFNLDAATCVTTKAYPPPSDPTGIPAANLEGVLVGSNAPCTSGIDPGPGGNIELGDTVIDNTFGPAWQAYTEIINLVADLPDGNTITASSLLYDDWVVPLGALTLGKKYIIDALVANCGILPGDPGFPTDAELDALLAIGVPGELPPFLATTSRLSDGNIEYIKQDIPIDAATGPIWMGLAGDVDISNKLPDLALCPGGTPPIRTPQASEAVKVTVDGLTTYLYSMYATESGVLSDDTSKSFTGNYEVHVPFDPPLVAKTGDYEGSNLVHWEMEWINPNPLSVLVRVVDPIAEAATFFGDPETGVQCEGELYDLPPTLVPTCRFDAQTHSVVFEGYIAPRGRIRIGFRVLTTSPSTSNTPLVQTDTTGSGTLDPDDPVVVPPSLPGSELPAVATRPSRFRIPQPVPTAGPWGTLSLLIGLPAAALLGRRMLGRARRKPGDTRRR